ncbi:MAG TPA: hypothetical protein PJ994_05340 [Tepidiformaceae bacterium]|nr:hypothetical protein [Tepidiformaceae bacterium]HMO96635.1 hypothetical protein [Tepidiformaceae bacterium]
MDSVRGIAIALVLFAFAFGLHIVGGALEWAWLFGFAVALIFLVATGFPAFALWFAGLKYPGGPRARQTYVVGTIIAMGLTLGALWAANDRTFGTFTFVLTPILVAVVSSFLLMVKAWREGEFARPD